MPENVLMTVDMIGAANLNCFIYVFLRYIYRFPATYSLQDWDVKENRMRNIYGSFFECRFWKICRFLLVFTIEKFGCESKIQMEYGTNFL